MRGQLQASRLIFRPIMSPAFENPPIPIDAEGAALIDVQVNRDPQTGAITSGTVIFDVDYRFPAPVTNATVPCRSCAMRCFPVRITRPLATWTRRAWAVRPMILRTHHGADAPRSPRAHPSWG